MERGPAEVALPLLHETSGIQEIPQAMKTKDRLQQYRLALRIYHKGVAANAAFPNRLPEPADYGLKTPADVFVSKMIAEEELKHAPKKP
jgi:hypothetical protein